ncbi:MAG: Trm112 family protein [Crenarchaeota archaeon]|nr:Trm112 family protein [Thermoproteota archaeon]
MKYRLLNFIACPYCKDKGFPLKLVVIDSRRYENRVLPSDLPRPLCDLYCGYRNEMVKKEQEYPCDECIKIEIVTGLLICPSCNRWFPIIDEIPRLLPDEYRKKEEDVGFLKRYEDRIPDEVKERGKPYNLKS